MADLGVLVVIVPQHRTTLSTEAPLGSAHFCGFIVLVKSQRCDIDPVRSAWIVMGNALDLVFTPDDVEGIVVAHNIDGPHESPYFPTDGTLA